MDLQISFEIKKNNKSKLQPSAFHIYILFKWKIVRKAVNQERNGHTNLI